MSTPGFAFPPPPPPPPQRGYDANTPAPRGRGYGGGSFRGLGATRGSVSQRGNPVGGRGRDSSYTSHGAQKHTDNRSISALELNPSFKRTHGGAFTPHIQSRPQAPPAVPSFNASIENLLTPRPPVRHGEPKTPSTKKTNFLGLTPANAERSDSENDHDEESRLVNMTSPDNLHFEYKGQTSTLRTQSEIAAWLAERRKRWPTQEKREAARKEAEERKLRWEEEKRKRTEAIQAAKKTRGEDSRNAAVHKGAQKLQARLPSAQAAGSDAVFVAQSRAEHLRRKALKAQKQLHTMEAKVIEASTHNTAEDIRAEPVPEGTNDDSSGQSSDSSESSDLSESTSSLESASEAGSAPDESSSRVEVEEIAIKSRKPPAVKRSCQFFTKHGTCKYGAKCRYSHDLKQVSSKDSRVKTAGSKLKRKGLWQVMVEKEEEEERKKVLDAIITLGKQGVLDDPS